MQKLSAELSKRGTHGQGRP